MGDAPAKPTASAVRRLQRDLRQWERDYEELGLPVLLHQLEAQDWLARLAINMAPKVSRNRLLGRFGLVCMKPKLCKAGKGGRGALQTAQPNRHTPRPLPRPLAASPPPHTHTSHCVLKPLHCAPASAPPGGSVRGLRVPPACHLPARLPARPARRTADGGPARLRPPQLVRGLVVGANARARGLLYLFGYDQTQFRGAVQGERAIISTDGWGAGSGCRGVFGLGE